MTDKKNFFIVNGEKVDANGKPIETPKQAEKAAAETDLQSQVQELTDERDRLQREINAARLRIKELEDIVKVGKPENERLTSEVARLTTERDNFQQGMQTAQQDRDDLQRQADSMTIERDAAQKALAEGKLLPPREQAIPLIGTIKRVSDEMAGEIYDVLVNPPPPATE